MSYKALSVLVVAFLSVGLYDNSSELASTVCLIFIGAMLLLDATEFLLRKIGGGRWLPINR